MSEPNEPVFSNEPLDLDLLPRLEDGQFRPLATKARTLDLLSTGLGMGIVWLGITIGVGLAFGRPAVFFASGAIAVLTVALLLGSLLSFRHRGWQLRAHDLSYRSGVLSRRTVTIPFTRVQHAAVSDGPIGRSLGLATLQVFTAGGVTADLVIPGLTLDHAEQLKAHVLAAAGTSA